MKGVDYENQKKWTRKIIALYSILDVAIQIFHAGDVSVTHDLEYLRLIRDLGLAASDKPDEENKVYLTR